MTTQTRSGSLGDALLSTASRAPGLICVFANGRATHVRYPLVEGQLMLGRIADHATVVDDRVSREHLRVSRDGSGWSFEDLDSRNGSWVDGRRIDRERVASFRTLRIGGALLVPTDDVFAHDAERVRRPDHPVVGARLARVLDHIAQIAAMSSTIHITGETGAGKELAARQFHDAGPRRTRSFVPVNCAAIPPHLAERMLFGAQRGAYTGAVSDATGLVQSAQGGTLFLDEIVELDLAVQAKLLRLLDSGEVLPLGATQARHLSLGICSASHAALAGAVSRQRFRADLLYRISEPCIEIPPLRERSDEIAWHVQHTLDAVTMSSHVELVETCILSPWPGNVRELRAAIRAAAIAAQLRGATVVRTSDLALHPRQATREDPFSDQHIADALSRHAGNVSQAARALGVHRNRLRRWLDKRRILRSSQA
jgi:DNA-binding NtrC family response regulator